MSTPAEVVRDITAGFKSTRDEVADLRDRLERFEAKGDLPRAGIAAPSGYKRLQTHSGPEFVVDSHIRLADIPALRPKEAPPVSLERWLAATVCGERSADKDSPDFGSQLAGA